MVLQTRGAGDEEGKRRSRDLRRSGAIAELSNPVAVLMLVIDFDTEVAMNGITDFLRNSTGIYGTETVRALSSGSDVRTTWPREEIGELAEKIDFAKLMEKATVFADEHGDALREVLE